MREVLNRSSLWTVFWVEHQWKILQIREIIYSDSFTFTSWWITFPSSWVVAFARGRHRVKKKRKKKTRILPYEVRRWEGKGEKRLSFILVPFAPSGLHRRFPNFLLYFLFLTVLPPGHRCYSYVMTATVSVLGYLLCSIYPLCFSVNKLFQNKQTTKRQTSDFCCISVSRHHLTVETQSQSGSEVCPALHDYEYVHYPCLVDGGRTPTAVPIGKSISPTGTLAGYPCNAHRCVRQTPATPM